MEPSAALRIERMNYVLGALFAVAATLVFDQEVGLGVLVGAGISALNFSVLRRLVARMLRPPADPASGGPGAGALLFLPKMIGLAVAVVLAIYYLPVSPIAVAAGFSVFLVSIGIEAVRFLTRESHG